MKSLEGTDERLNDTLGTTNTMGTFRSTKTGTQRRAKRNRIKLFELYKDCGTVLQLSVALHRLVPPFSSLPHHSRKYHERETQPSVLPTAVSSDAAPAGSPTKPPQPPSRGSSRPSTRAPKSQIESPLERKLRITPYARMVFIFKYLLHPTSPSSSELLIRYDDNETLHMINDAITSVNSKALPDIQVPLPSHPHSP